MDAQKGTSKTFAPTGGVGSKLAMLLHICFGWSLALIDIKDAFLLVPQKNVF